MFQVITIVHKIIDQLVVVIHIGTEIHEQGGHINPSSTMNQIVYTILPTHRCQWTLKRNGIAHPSFFLAPPSQCGWGISSITVEIFHRTIFHKESYPMQPRVSVGSGIDDIYPISDGWEAVDRIDPTEQRGRITILLQYRHQLLTIHAE